MSKHVVALCVAMVLWSVKCFALDKSAFSEDSKLAHGSWVKIAVKDNGVYQLTADELAEMGFPDPSAVKVFGYGGHMMSESITAYSKDDLQQVPAICTDDGKLCFYANGVYQVSAVDYTTPRYFNVTINAYSSYGYYFLTDDSGYAPLKPEVAEYREMQDGDEAVEHSYAYFYHESELTSVGFSGKSLLGENMLSTMKYTGSADVPNIMQGSTLHVSTAVAGLLSSKGTIGVRINGVDAKISSGASLAANTNGSVFYNTVNSKGRVTPLAYPEKMPIVISVDCSGSASLLYLDKYIISYVQNNRLPADSSQVRLDIEDTKIGNNVKVTGVGTDAMVWNIDDAQRPVQCALHCEGGLDDTGYFSMPSTSAWSSFVVFDPQRELKSISGFEHVENQNLHGMETPDYVIVTTKELMEQAERVARLHRGKEGMEVAVIDQQLIFNEFSSGAADPSGVRMFMKMLYDRNPDKLRYLLLFGDGSYDNRRIIDKNPYEKLVTYQSTASNSDVASYVCDDYFGFLSDDASTNLQRLSLSIAVGRLSMGTADEAARVVDKLEEYVGSPDYGEWRNNAFVIADDDDDGLHEYQAVGMAELLDGGVSPKLNVWRIYDGAYPNVEGRSEDSNAVMEALLKQGQMFFTYIGHGAALNGLCLWDRADVERVKYDRWPFATFATCDVARFDGDAHGVAEQMVLERKGGVIACMVATRTVYSDCNDNLNRSLMRYLFSLDEDGNRRSIGEAYMLAKNSIRDEYEENKIKFVLLGDPALVLEYPLPLAHVEKIGDVDVGSSSSQAIVYPQTTIQVSGFITDADGNIDNGFDGEATVTLYDADVLYDDLADLNQEVEEQRSAMFHRELLAKSVAQVKSGRYEATLAVPKNCFSQGERGLVRVYAVDADGSKIVDGSTDNVIIQAYDAARAEKDDSAPEITEMYIDSEDFEEGGYTGSSIVLYASIADDKGINMQSLSMDGTFTLSLDGGFNTYPDVDGGFSVEGGGKSGTLAYQIDDLAEGTHTLTLKVSDMAGNVGERTVSFCVRSKPLSAVLSVEKRAVTDEVVFNLECSDAESVQNVYLTVLGSDGKAVMQQWVSAFPYVWDLTGVDGGKLAPGLYRFYGAVPDSSVSIVSTECEIVVLDL